MTSAIYWTLLGLVIERPSYGLELYYRYQRLYADVLPVSGESHIYSALDALEARGLIETVPGIGVSRQPKLPCKATPLGIRSYEDWLVEQIDVEHRRQELWVRQLAIFADHPGAALNVLGRYQRQYLKTAGQTGSRPEGAVTDSRGALIDELVAEKHRIADGGTLSWLQYTIARFEDRARSVAHDDPPQT